MASNSSSVNKNSTLGWEWIRGNPSLGIANFWAIQAERLKEATSSDVKLGSGEKTSQSLFKKLAHFGKIWFNYTTEKF